MWNPTSNTLLVLEEGLPHHDPEIYRTNSFRLLDDLAPRLAALKVAPSFMDRDGRTNSKLDEKTIINAIVEIWPETLLCMEGYKYDIPEERPYNKTIRDWYDILFYRQHSGFDREIIPVDIKSSSLERTDNCTGKGGIFYALTGTEPNFSNNINWKRYIEELEICNNPENGKDLFFLCMKKTNTRFVRVYSLKTLEKTVPNPSNFPFQINWPDNSDRIYRSPEEAHAFLRKGFFESVRRKMGSMGDLFNLLNGM